MISALRFVLSRLFKCLAFVAFLFIFFFFSQNRVTAQCPITITMYDSYGDGWNYAEIDIYVGGSYYNSVGLSYGSQGSYSFTVPTGSSVIFSWYPGYWDYECYFIITESGNTLYSCYDGSSLYGTFFTYTCGGGGSGGDPPVIVCTSNVVLDLNGTTPAPHLEADGFYYIDVCPGQAINFVANATPNSAGLIFSWSFQYYNNGTPVSQTASGRSTTFTPPISTGYNFVLMVEDNQGCKSFFAGRIRVSANPINHISPSNVICAGNTEQLTIGYDPSSIIQIDPIQSQQSVSMGIAGATFIPDGPNCPDDCYTSSVIFTNFSNTDVLQSPADIISVCLNIEHSYTDDLSIYLVCPNGSNTLLLNNHYLWRTGLMFGVPSFTDNSSNYCSSSGNPPGIGWNYCWSENSQFSYGNSGFSNMYAGMYAGGYAFNDYAYNAGHDYNYYRYGYTQRSVDSTHIGSGSQYYSPVNSFSSLVGCPLNGEWQIQVCDTWADDNGYVFSWDLNFSPNLISPTWSYNVPVDHVDWTCNWATIVNDTTVNISPPANTTPGNYSCTFTIYDDFGCSFSDQYPITVSRPTVTSINATEAVCGEPNGTATVVSPNAVSYSWNTTPPQTAATATGLTAGTYIVTLTDAHGCTGTASVTVPGSSANINLVITASSLYLCPDETAVLTASGANSYVWNTGATTASITVSAGTYTVTGNVDGCEVTEEITILKSPPMEITFDIVEPICNDPNGELTANVSGGISPFQYTWNNGAHTQIIQNLPAGTYTVTVTDDYGCTKTASVTLNSTAPTVSVVTTQSHCGQHDGTAILHICDGIPPYSYDWNLPETNEDTAFSLCAGSYSVLVRDSLCEVNFQFTITDAPLPTACFGVNQTYALLGTQLFFINCSSPNVTWFWDLGDGTTSTIENPEYTYPNIGDYNVFLTVTDAFGCTNTTIRNIVIYETSVVFVPNAFTPNFDNKNEVFKPSFYNVSPDNYSLIIYNRWGEEIFRTTDINKGWDGKVNGNPILTNTVFVYVLNYSDLMGAKFMKKGTVTIALIPPY